MNLQDVLNTIRDNASDIYRDRVPEATRTNIQDIGGVITNPNNAVVANEFISTLLNMVALQVIHSKIFSDPLKSLKKGTKPLGDTVEEIYANFVQAKGFDPSGADLLTREMPDVKACYHRMNRQDKYKVTITPEMLAKAFTSYEKLESLIQQIINSLYNSSELDEFVLIKQLIKQAIDNNAMVVVNVDEPTANETNAKNFIKTVKTISGDMVFPNSNNNAYLTAQSSDNKAIITKSDKSEQILIIDNPTDVSVSIDVLASVFNMSVAEFNDTRKIVIDAFPDPSIRACLVDESFFQVFDDLVMFKEFENQEGLYKNYYLHVWQTLAYSILVNAVAFKLASDEDEDGTVEEFTVTNTLKTGVKTSNPATKVAEGSSYEAILTGVKGTDTVLVTMGTHKVEGVDTPTDITSTAYNSTKKTISIDKVTANVAISVS